MSEVIRQIQSILYLPEMKKYNEAQWHDVAVECLMPAEDDSVRRIARVSFDLLRSFPYEDLDGLIEQAPDDAVVFKQLRQMRKILTIGRDALNLTNATDFIDVEATEPFRSFVMALGVVSDTNCRDVSALNVARSLLTPAAGAMHELPARHLRPVAYSELTPRLSRALASDMLLGETPANTTEEAYHTARQSFRAVVYTGIVSQVVSPTADKLQFVREGLRINRNYGGIRNGLKATGDPESCRE